MKHLLFFCFVILFLIVSISSCKQKHKKPSNAEVAAYQEHLVSINKLVVEHLSDSIKKSNEHKHLGLSKSKTGLWYKVFHVGKGDSAKANQVATISYSVRLFNGKLCYSTDSTGPKNIVIGRSGMETGLEEGLLMMKVGDSAIFVLPPHLAHGLLGDQKKIPRMAIISYQVVLQGVQK
jgi:FKBP-type peptidyl-prolyl cis-trans isomerase FkpA